MPLTSMFYGIIIRVYCGLSEHNPPHFHVYYQDYVTLVNSDTWEIYEEEPPSKHAKLYTVTLIKIGS